MLTPTLLLCYGMRINQAIEIIISVDRIYVVEECYVIDWTNDSNEMEDEVENCKIDSGQCQNPWACMGM